MSEIDTKQDNKPLPKELGLYVHVPFCATTCDFCAFYQERPTADSVEAYLGGVAKETELVRWDGPVTTVFWGGGTPGLLAADDIRRLGETINRRLGAPLKEWSVELAPGSVTVERLRALKDIGVTRISMGVQTFKAELLEALGRRHSRDQVYRAVERIQSGGFASMNLDLMFALPGQEEEAWLADLHEAMALKPDHISTYCLTFEEDTALWVKLSKGKVKLDTEREARLYERTWAELAAAGYAQYEISNFAKAGHECRHNLNTWRMQEWVGLGPSGSSQHAGWRGTNIADTKEWLSLLAAGKRATEDRTELTAGLLAEDALIFGLRMNEGVDVAGLQTRYADADWDNVRALLGRLISEGFAERRSADDRLALTLKGRLVADAVGSELLGAMSTVS